MERLLSAQEAADALGLNKSRVLQLIRAGRLPALRIGSTSRNQYAIREADLELVRERKGGRPRHADPSEAAEYQRKRRERLKQK